MIENLESGEEADNSQSVASIKQIALQHISKISGLCCQEFTGSYWEEKPIKIGSGIVITKVYHQDGREAFCNAINFLVSICYPYTSSDSEFRKYIDTIKKEEKGKIIKIEERLIKRLDMFDEINKMFEQETFFDSSLDIVDQ